MASSFLDSKVMSGDQTIRKDHRVGAMIFIIVAAIIVAAIAYVAINAAQPTVQPSPSPTVAGKTIQEQIAATYANSNTAPVTSQTVKQVQSTYKSSKVAPTSPSTVTQVMETYQ